MAIRTALVLAGHGSHLSPETAGLVWQHVDTLRRSGVADEVTAAFWKEMPAFHDVLRSLTADDVTVVPLFTARGYFTQTVIPAEMGLTGSITCTEGRTIRYARTLGEHPLIASFGIQRVKQCLASLGPNISADQVAVALIGHSTRLNPESRRAAEAQAESIRAAGIAGQVVTVFLDDTPEIAEIYRLTTAPILIGVPYFLASGSHVSVDVPRQLGLAVGQSTGQIQGRTMYYTEPVGAEGWLPLPRLILDLAREAQDLSPSLPSPPARLAQEREIDEAGLSWHSFPQAGQQTLVDSVQRTGMLTFGQLRLTTDCVSAIQDVNAGARFSALPEMTTLTTPGQLRSSVRGVPFRPLPTACDLPAGWRVPVERPERLHAVVETIYPGAVADWAAHQAGTLPIEPLGTVVARQTGMFRALQDLSAAEQAGAVDTVCGGCVRHPTWHYGESPEGAIPCAAPCNWWMSHALNTMKARKMENGEA